MKKFKLIFFVCSIVMLAVSCKDDEEPDLSILDSTKTTVPDSNSNSNSNSNTGNTDSTSTVAKIVINEVVSNPSSGGSDWIELYNSGTATVDLSGYVLADSKGLADASAYTIPDGTTLAAGKYLVFVNATSFTFGLGKSGDEVILADTAGKEVDHLTFGEMPNGDQSYGRKPDGSSNLYYFESSTQGDTNNSSTVIN